MIKPTPQQVTEYALSLGFKLDGFYFCDRYEVTGWRYGSGKGIEMRDWKAAVRMWKRNATPSALLNSEIPRYDPEKLEKRKRELEEIKEREWQRRQGSPEDWTWSKSDV